jgi:hypothetical protein
VVPHILVAVSVISRFCPEQGGSDNKTNSKHKQQRRFNIGEKVKKAYYRGKYSYSNIKI